MRVILLQNQNKAVPLHQVFHGIRFKVNKGWVKALTLFLYPYVRAAMSYELLVSYERRDISKELEANVLLAFIRLFVYSFIR